MTTTATYQLPDVLALTRLDENIFWNLYRSGMIPPAAWLPGELDGAVWDRATIDTWLANGRPAMPGVLEHQARVFNALRAGGERC